jgi:hypothetical protein
MVRFVETPEVTHRSPGPLSARREREEQWSISQARKPPWALEEGLQQAGEGSGGREQGERARKRGKGREEKRFRREKMC